MGVTSSLFEPARQALHGHLFSRSIDESSIRYRYEHCLRVGAIGRTVALAEGLDADLLELACLLHDIGKFDATVAVDHGRAGARIAKSILDGLGLGEAEQREVLQGIAMHTDGKWNYDQDSPDHPGFDLFTAQPSVLSRSVGDCDNVDRYSLLRIHGTMNWVKFSEKTTPEALSWIDEYLAHLDRERTYVCATETAQELWMSALDDHEQYFTRLAQQLKSGLTA